MFYGAPEDVGKERQFLVSFFSPLHPDYNSFELILTSLLSVFRTLYSPPALPLFPLQPQRRSR